ncbi:hypothetical protein G5B39_02245 [Rhodobacteraceae bacterium SC52]|nr:hypothetical protein G5B39_02245 [Rhodobacteraceae bacterium SC52]
MKDPLTLLEVNLERERTSLLAGRFEALEELNLEKMSLATSLPGGESDTARVERILARSRSNQRLAEAAGEGLKAAMRRLGEVERLDGGTGHYSSCGARTKTPNVSRTLRRV